MISPELLLHNMARSKAFFITPSLISTLILALFLQSMLFYADDYICILQLKTYLSSYILHNSGTKVTRFKKGLFLS